MPFVLRDEERYGYYVWNTDEFSNAILQISIYGFGEKFELTVDGKFYIWNETPIDEEDDDGDKVSETEDSYFLYDYKKYRRLEIKKKDLKKISEKEFKRRVKIKD